MSSTTLLSGRYTPFLGKRNSDLCDIQTLMTFPIFLTIVWKAFVNDMQDWHLDYSHVILIMIRVLVLGNGSLLARNVDFRLLEFEL